MGEFIVTPFVANVTGEIVGLKVIVPVADQALVADKLKSPATESVGLVPCANVVKYVNERSLHVRAPVNVTVAAPLAFEKNATVSEEVGTDAPGTARYIVCEIYVPPMLTVQVEPPPAVIVPRLTCEEYIHTV
jgi:hypothetical protein